MSTPGVLEVDPGFHPGMRDSPRASEPVATWKLGGLVLSGLPQGPSAWIVKTAGGDPVQRGWFSTETGRAAILLPSYQAGLILEIRSGAERWRLPVPARRS